MKKTLIIALLLTSPAFTAAFTIEHAPNAPVEDRFIVGPVKVESVLEAGETGEFIVEIENRTGRTETYTFSFEDFSASSEAGQVVDLLGERSSNTSLKDAFSVEERSVTLEHGDRARIPVSIFMPAQAEAGGKFGAMIVSSQLAHSVTSDASSAQATMVGRIAVLFFVTVPADGLAKGELVDFELVRNGSIFSPAELFRITYRNDGSMHVNPYGVITVRNLLGSVVEELPIDPFYVLPGAVRTRDIVSEVPLRFGFYRATLSLNRGYDDIVDTQEISFAVARPGAILLVLLVAGVAFVVFRNKRAR